MAYGHHVFPNSPRAARDDLMSRKRDVPGLGSEGFEDAEPRADSRSESASLRPQERLLP